jgi:hypothetical protein
VYGHVVTTLGQPVPGADIAVSGTSLRTLADRAGKFSLPEVPEGLRDLTARAIGYSPVDFSLQLSGGDAVELEIVMAQQTPVLEPVRVEATSGEGVLAAFYRRKAAGRGYFLERSDIARRATRSAAELLRTIPGVRLKTAGGTSLNSRVEFDRCASVAVWIDGVPAVGKAGDVLRTVDPSWIEAIEVYSGLSQLPAEFTGRENCAAIVIWSRMK